MQAVRQTRPVKHALQGISVDGQKVAVSAEKDPAAIRALWSELKRAYGDEATAVQAVLRQPQIINPSYTDPPAVISRSKAVLVGYMGEEESIEVMLKNPALLQCGAMYPLPPEHVHLRVMDLFRDIYGSPVGFSDHTLGTAVTLAAAARGADVIEKHFTHDRSAEGPDHFYALEPDELTRVIEETRRVFAALGDARKDMLPAEREFGRREGLYAVRDLKAGAVIGLGDIDIRRPAIGLRARHANAVVGMHPTRHIAAGEALQWGDLAP